MKTRVRGRVGIGAAVSVCAAAFLVTACRREAAERPGAAGWTPPVSPDAPLSQQTAPEAARHLLQFLQAHLQAVAHGRNDLAARFRDRAARELVARDDLLSRYRAVAGRFAVPDEEALRRIVESWAAVIAYYADGLALDDLRPGPISGDLARTVVDVPAGGPGDDVLIRLACLRGEDDRWRVAGIEFVPPASPPATAPAAATSSATAPTGPEPGR
ncbi:MAG: hypothetical protein AB1601_02780 [Planctomycetota bacterium]